MIVIGPAFTLRPMDLQASLVPADYVDPAVFAAEIARGAPQFVAADRAGRPGTERR